MDEVAVNNTGKGRLAKVETLPVLDLAAFLAGEDGAAENLAPQLRAACEFHGSFTSKTMASSNR